jgi:hypothetical protein
MGGSSNYGTNSILIRILYRNVCDSHFQIRVQRGDFHTVDIYCYRFGNSISAKQIVMYFPSHLIEQVMDNKHFEILQRRQSEMPEYDEMCLKF